MVPADILINTAQALPAAELIFLLHLQRQTFERAVATWKEIVGANLTAGSTTTVQAVKDDDINVIVFDNNNTGVPKMADGVLEATYSWFSACQSRFAITYCTKNGF